MSVTVGSFRWEVWSLTLFASKLVTWYLQINNRHLHIPLLNIKDKNKAKKDENARHLARKNGIRHSVNSKCVFLKAHDQLGMSDHVLLAQAACVRHACLRAPCMLACAMRSLAIVITIVQSLFLSLSPLFSPSFAFDPLRGNSCVRKFVSPNILA